MMLEQPSLFGALLEHGATQEDGMKGRLDVPVTTPDGNRTTTTPATPPDITVREPARQTCTDHCSTCGRHFHGLGAFDAHRRENTCGAPETALNTKGRLVLQVWTLDGYCQLTPGCWRDGKRDHWEHPVTIWQVYGSSWDGPHKDAGGVVLEDGI